MLTGRRDHGRAGEASRPDPGGPAEAGVFSLLNGQLSGPIVT